MPNIRSLFYFISRQQATTIMFVCKKKKKKKKKKKANERARKLLFHATAKATARLVWCVARDRWAVGIAAYRRCDPALVQDAPALLCWGLVW